MRHLNWSDGKSYRTVDTHATLIGASSLVITAEMVWPVEQNVCQTETSWKSKFILVKIITVLNFTFTNPNFCICLRKWIMITMDGSWGWEWEAPGAHNQICWWHLYNPKNYKFLSGLVQTMNITFQFLVKGVLKILFYWNTFHSRKRAVTEP